MGEPGLYSGNRHRHIPLPSMGHYFRSSRGSRHWRTVGWQTHTRSSQSRAGRFCRISLGGNFKGIALRLFRGCLHLCSILISFSLSFSHKSGRTSTAHCWQVKGSLILKWKVLPKPLLLIVPCSIADISHTSLVFCCAKYREGVKGISFSVIPYDRERV